MGVSSSPVSTSASASEDTSSESPSDDAQSDNQKAYEVDKKPSVTKSSSNNLVYVVIGALIIGVLLGLGYMRTRKE